MKYTFSMWETCYFDNEESWRQAEDSKYRYISSAWRGNKSFEITRHERIAIITKRAVCFGGEFIKY